MILFRRDNPYCQAHQRDVFGLSIRIGGDNITLLTIDEVVMGFHFFIKTVFEFLLDYCSQFFLRDDGKIITASMADEMQNMGG